MTRRFPLLIACTLVATTAAGCGEPDYTLARWGYLSPTVFQPTCATPSCHSPAAAVSGLDFSTSESGYKSLTGLWTWIVVSPDGGTAPAGVPCAPQNGALVCQEMLRPLVTPYDPAGSRLVNVLRARDAPRMPPDRPLPDAEIKLVERWILNGACETGVGCDPNGAPVAPPNPTADGGADLGSGG